MSRSARVAYLSMEIALESAMPTYAGGLGVLAGDTIRSFADLGLGAVALTLLHRKGHFRQRLDWRGNQIEEPAHWPIEKLLQPLDARVDLQIGERRVRIRPWGYTVTGVNGSELPTYLLDTDLPENAPEDRTLSDLLYGGDEAYRLRQEIVLGIGGVRVLRALGYKHIERFHLNEGHAALAVLALLEEELGGVRVTDDEFQKRVQVIKRRCVFTTHTPVPSGHDQFPMALVASMLGAERASWLRALGQRDVVNLTSLALKGSRFVNGVAMRHGEVSQGMFPGYPIRSITNGIHPPTWAAPSFRALFDRHIREWRRDSLSLRYAVRIPASEIWWAHSRAKGALLRQVKRQTGEVLDPEAFTLGFARRATGYKRAALAFSDPERLRALCEQSGPMQFVLAGKAHPRDHSGKELIRSIFRAREALSGQIRVVYLPDYDMELAKVLVAGSDVWLNTPLPPLEASGTSGMKAALNGVPSLSVLDGWWLEGCVEGVTGWAIGNELVGDHLPAAERDRQHAEALYDKLGREVLPTYYRDRERYIWIMRNTIALNASFFNTQRMALQYLYDAYLEPGQTPQL
jgi:starch phosphorylase